MKVTKKDYKKRWHMFLYSLVIAIVISLIIFRKYFGYINNNYFIITIGAIIIGAYIYFYYHRVRHYKKQKKISKKDLVKRDRQLILVYAFFSIVFLVLMILFYSKGINSTHSLNYFFGSLSGFIISLILFLYEYHDLKKLGKNIFNKKESFLSIKEEWIIFVALFLFIIFILCIYIFVPRL